MNQRAFLQGFDALAFDAFRAAGVADTARYVAPDGQEWPCTVLLDEDVQQFTDDDLAPVSTSFDRITLQLSEVKPQGGGVVHIDSAGRRLKLVKRLRADASTEQWEVASV